MLHPGNLVVSEIQVALSDDLTGFKSGDAQTICGRCQKVGVFKQFDCLVKNLVHSDDLTERKWVCSDSLIIESMSAQMG